MDFEAIARHEKVALHFSGGKDSLACLWLLEAYWEKILVCWVNTGDALPEVEALVRKVAAMVPNFVEVKSDVKAHQAKWGYPCDVVPVRNHPTVAFIVHPHPRPPLQSFFACCRDNLWMPMQRKMEELGVTLIIRGQRLQEVQRSPVRSGDTYAGFEFLFPIENWTDEEVRRYVASKPLGLPEWYAYTTNSPECAHCTGHLFENIGKMRYLRARHPAVFDEVQRRLGVISGEVLNDLRAVDAAMAVAYEPEEGANATRH